MDIDFLNVEFDISAKKSIFIISNNYNKEWDHLIR